jgi:hypothetical protein
MDSGQPQPRRIRVACLGWGSLVWRPGALPLAAAARAWNPDGPELPVEYARQSQNFPLTLVISAESKPVRVLWAELDARSGAEARAKLAARETKSAPPELVCGLWERGASVDGGLGVADIAAWAEARNVDAVVWTKLSPLFNGEKRVPTCNEVIDYISWLKREQQVLAFEYIRKTPRQVTTVYRAAIESRFGIAPDPSTDGFIAPPAP